MRNIFLKNKLKQVKIALKNQAKPVKMSKNSVSVALNAIFKLKNTIF